MRKEIQSIRAIAVVGVVLFHGGLAFTSGGFLGVDIFFVISGYLIFNIIYREITNGNFNLLAFIGRRIKRLYPSYLLILFGVTLAASFFVSGDQFLAYADSLNWSLFQSANIYFKNHTGYFDSAATTQPLLHLWSTSVEWQFYLFVALLVIGLYKFCKAYIPHILLGIALISFILTTAGISNTDSMFYLLTFRIW